MEADVLVGAFLDLGNKVDRLHQKIDRSRPVHKSVGGAITVPVGFTLPILINLTGFPSVNRVWNVLKVGFFSGDLHTTIANISCDVYAGTLPDPNAPVLTEGITSLAVAQIVNFTKESEWCEPGQGLFGLIFGTGVVAGQNFQLVARVSEFWVDAVEARTI